MSLLISRSIFFRIVEIRTKIISVSSYLIGTLLAVYHHDDFLLVPAMLMFFATIFVDMGTTAFNTYFDYVRGVDRLEHNREKEKVLVYAGVSPKSALWVAIVLYGLAIILGALLAWQTSWWLAPVGAVCMLVGFLYTGGPLPISSTPIGELFAGGFLGGVLCVLAYFVQAEQITFIAVVSAIPSTLMVASILAVNNACDVIGDFSAGRKTAAVLLWPKYRAVPIYILFWSGLVVAGLISYIGIWSIYVLILLFIVVFPSLYVFFKMEDEGFSHSSKPSSMQRISLLFSFYSAAVVIGLVLGIILKMDA